jgi:hypothetical protein
MPWATGRDREVLRHDGQLIVERSMAVHGAAFLESRTRGANSRREQLA